MRGYAAPPWEQARSLAPKKSDYADELVDAQVVALPRRLTPRKPVGPFTGRIVAIDTEGSAMTNVYTATVKADGEEARRFTEPGAFADYLISLFRDNSRRSLVYCHNLEWDLQVLWLWLEGTDLTYVGHSARRNGSALVASFDYPNRSKKHARVTIRDSFAIYPMSLAELGRVVGIPKLKTPRAYMPKLVNYETGALIESPSYEDSDSVRCSHDRVECTDCYDLRDVEILHAAMRLYIAECDAAHVKPAFTRSAHAMADFRANFLPEPMVQYTEKQNVRAGLARYGGRVQMLRPGLLTCTPEHVIVQADVKSQYPSIMIRGGFPDAGEHVILHRAAPSRVREFVGFAFADVTVPAMPLGPLIYRHPVSGRISYPTDARLQAAWTTDELAYALDVGCTITDIVRLEGTPRELAVDPFSTFIHTKYRERAALKAAGSPMQEAVKLTMNGLSGKFGMQWMEDRLEFVAATENDFEEWETPRHCMRKDAPPKRYPDYIMMIWSALIMARGRIVLHRAGARWESMGAELLCCDTDSWTMRVPRAWMEAHADEFGGELGDWDIEGKYVAFRGTAPKEYALYATPDELFNRTPTKGRAKGVAIDGGPVARLRGVDHYLRGNRVHFSRPHKTLSVLRGAPMATFQPMHKAPAARPPSDTPIIYLSFRDTVRRRIAEAEANTLRAQREEASEPGRSTRPEASVRLPWEASS